MCRNVLFDQRDTQAPRTDDVSLGRLHVAGETFEKRRFSRAIGGNEAETVALADDEGQVLEQGRVGDDADIAKIQGSHFLDLIGAARLGLRPWGARKS